MAEDKFTISLDSTDHLTWHHCNVPMQTLGVITPRAFYVASHQVDKCTTVMLRCPECGKEFQRKFYWNRPRKVRVSSHEAAIAMASAFGCRIQTFTP